MKKKSSPPGFGSACSLKLSRIRRRSRTRAHRANLFCRFPAIKNLRVFLHHVPRSCKRKRGGSARMSRGWGQLAPLCAGRCAARLRPLSCRIRGPLFCGGGRYPVGYAGRFFVVAAAILSDTRAAGALGPGCWPGPARAVCGARSDLSGRHRPHWPCWRHGRNGCGRRP